MKQNRTMFITQAAFIAALYVVLTYLASIFGLASGVIQIRLSEMLCIMPVFTPAAIPGLFAGCLLSNILTGCCLIDVIFGSLATLIGAVLGYVLRNHKYLVPIPTILANAIIVPFVLIYGYGEVLPYFYLFGTVGAGEVISAGVMGIALMIALSRIPFFRDGMKGNAKTAGVA
ncbi:MAG: QueT transporter family protein [Lachnospiraceae bacterium]|nr:QueT transporter family protein [Lachnospiraceae bacterium]